MCKLCAFTKSTQYLILNASKASNKKYETIPNQKGHLSIFLAHSDFPSSSGFVIFFPKFFIASKGSLVTVLIFCNRMDVKKLQKVPFSFFGTMRLVKIPIFCLILNFLNRYPPKTFFNTIRIFDVIPELYCVSLWRRRRFKNKRSRLSQHAFDVISEVICSSLGRRDGIKKRPHLSQCAIPELQKRFPSTKGTL